jgi:hypothetical protein
MPGLYGNDIYPDCTAVALANAARAVAVLNGADLVVEPQKVSAFYAQCVGNPPDLAATSGAVALEVLEMQTDTGFDIGPQALVGQHGTIALSRNALALAIDTLGVGYWGVTLRERDMEIGPVWDVSPGRDDGAVVGGHMVIGWDYLGLADGATVRIGTWGKWQPATWGWIAARLQEAHGVVWRQLARPDGSFCGAASADVLMARLEGLI